MKIAHNEQIPNLRANKRTVSQHPDVVKKVWRYERWHHQVDYSQFKNNRLIPREGISIKNKVNNYGMKLIEAKNHKICMT